jgi:hypothetical protein
MVLQASARAPVGRRPPPAVRRMSVRVEAPSGLTLASKTALEAQLLEAPQLQACCRLRNSCRLQLLAVVVV